MGITTHKVTGSAHAASWSQDVAFLNAKELKAAQALVDAEVKKAPKMNRAMAAAPKANDGTVIRCRYLAPLPIMKYLKPPTRDMWNIMAATTNAVLDGKKITKDEAQLLKKVFNQVIQDNPDDKKAIQDYLFKVQMNVRKTAPKTEKGIFEPLYDKNGPLNGYNHKGHVYAIVPPLHRPAGIISPNWKKQP